MSVIKGAAVVQQMMERLHTEVDGLKARNISPRAIVVRVGENPSCIAYGKGAVKKLESLGIAVSHAVFPEDITHEAFAKAFKEINDTPSIHGILLLRPLPPQLKESEISHIVDPYKDVDSINPLNMYKVMVGDTTAFPPCTPEAVMHIVDYMGIELTGKRVVIIGASMVVGRPLYLLMLNRNATCIQCHIHTKDLAAECRGAEIIVVAAGKRGLIGEAHVRPGTIVIDVGINIGEDEKIYGDVLFDKVEPLAAYITPVPGGVGSVTSTVLAAHVIKAVQMQCGLL